MNSPDMIIRRHSPYGAPHLGIPTMIVIHAMGEFLQPDHSEEFVHAADFLLQQNLSAHALIAPDGKTYRCREDNEGAYHARGFNTGSLGVEVLVPGEHDYGSFLNAIRNPWVSDVQYAALVTQCREWIALHGIAKIVRHSDLSPGRKIDPGEGFPWLKFLEDLK